MGSVKEIDTIIFFSLTLLKMHNKIISGLSVELLVLKHNCAEKYHALI